MRIQNLFPTPVAFFNLGRDLTEKERTFMLEQPTHKNEGNTTSNNRNVLEDPVLADLKSFIDEGIDEYLQTVAAPKFDVSLRITQSWLNYSEPGQFHHKHYHPNSFYSGCFYVNADPEFDKIYFFRDGYERIKLTTEKWNVYNSESWWLSVGTGQLIIFPSYLTHMVQTVEASETRISIAFNTFPVGYVGNDENLTGLHL